MAESESQEHAEPVIVAAYSDLGEAEVAQAKLRAFGIESVLADRVEGGVLLAGDDANIGIEVRAADAADAAAILVADDPAT